MSAKQQVHELRASRSGAPSPKGYETDGTVAILQQELAARLALSPRQDDEIPQASLAERCIRGLSRASGPLLLLAGYGAVAGLAVHILL